MPILNHSNSDLGGESADPKMDICEAWQVQPQVVHQLHQMMNGQTSIILPLKEFHTQVMRSWKMEWNDGDKDHRNRGTNNHRSSWGCFNFITSRTTGNFKYWTTTGTNSRGRKIKTWIGNIFARNSRVMKCQEESNGKSGNKTVWKLNCLKNCN